MGWLEKLRMRLRALRHGEEVHGEIAEEWQFHIDLRTEENIRRGMTPEEARQSAEQHFGNAGYIKDVSWDVRGGGIMETLWQDVRCGARQLRRSPGFTFVALLSLGLGIGGNAVIFSLISTILLRPLPISHPEQVFAIHQGKEKDASYSQSMSYPNYKDIRDRNAVLSGMAVYRFDPMSLSHNGCNERVWGYLVSGNYFDVLGVQAFLGRTFTVDEDRTPNSRPVAVLSYGCWQRRFGADPGVVGQDVLINGHSFKIIGITPEGFSGTEMIYTPEIWVPMLMQEWIEPGHTWLDNRGTHNIFTTGRLKPGVTPQQAEASLNVLAAQLGKEYPNSDEGVTIQLMPPGFIIPSIRGAFVSFTTILMATVVLVLAVACANLAGLLLARASGRRREIAIRLAMGASRWRLIRQLLTESALLALMGGVLGVVLAVWIINLVIAFKPPLDVPINIGLYVDWRVLAFSLLVSSSSMRTFSRSNASSSSFSRRPSWPSFSIWISSPSCEQPS